MADTIGTSPEAADYGHDPDTALLLGILREMQRLRPGKPFWASVHDVARELGRAPMWASRRLNMLIEDGLLEVVEPATATRARRFRYRGALHFRDPNPPDWLAPGPPDGRLRDDPGPGRPDPAQAA